MERINNFKKFSKIYENEEIEDNVEKKEELIKSEKEASEEIDKLANPQNSSIVSKIKSSVENLEKSAPQTLKENIDAEQIPSMSVQGETTEWKEAMDSLLKNLIPRLPKLIYGSPTAKRVGMTDLVAEYYPVDYKLSLFSGGPLRIIYKEQKYNRPDLYPDLEVEYGTDRETIDHLYSIFEELSKREKMMDFINKATRVVGTTLQVVGGLAVAACFLYFFGQLVKGNPNYSQGEGGYESGKGGYKSDYSDILPDSSLYLTLGYGGILSGSLGTLLRYLGQGGKNDMIRGLIGDFANILRAHLEPTGMKVTDLKTIADINAVLQSTGEIANVTKTTYKTESVSTKNIKGFNKFKY